MKKNNFFYDDKVVYKPWGYEHVIYRNLQHLSVTLLRINYNKNTSLHCHPNKKTGFIVVSGKAIIQLGLWKNTAKYYKAPSKLMIRTGLFHSIKAVSKGGLFALEFETPFNKNDLVRFKDNYGRQSKPYEGKKFTKRIDSNFIKFKRPTLEKNQLFKINKVNISLEIHKNFKDLTNKKVFQIDDPFRIYIKRFINNCKSNSPMGNYEFKSAYFNQKTIMKLIYKDIFNV